MQLRDIQDFSKAHFNIQMTDEENKTEEEATEEKEEATEESE